MLTRKSLLKDLTDSIIQCKATINSNNHFLNYIHQATVYVEQQIVSEPLFIPLAIFKRLRAVCNFCNGWYYNNQTNFNDDCEKYMNFFVKFMADLENDIAQKSIDHGKLLDALTKLKSM